MKKKKVSKTESVKPSCIPQIAIGAGIFFVIQILFISFNFFGLEKTFFGNIFITIISFLAFLSMLCLYKRFPHNFPMERKAKLFLLISTSLFFLGDLLWLFEEAVLKNIMPLGQFPDLFWTLGYVALMTSIQFFIKMEFRESKKLLNLLIVLSIIVGGLFLYFDIAYSLNEGVLTFGGLIQDLYPVYDIAVFAMIFYLLWPLIITKNTYFIGWFWLGLGVLTRLIYDIVFIIMNKNHTYYTGHPIDLVYELLYIFIILNSWHKSQVLSKFSAEDTK